MRLHEQRDRLVATIELIYPYLGSGPTSSHYGHAREDCALVHMDYFSGIQSARGQLVDVIAEITGEEPPEAHKRLRKWDEETPCDCRACAGEEAASEAREKARAAYTNVKEWR